MSSTNKYLAGFRPAVAQKAIKDQAGLEQLNASFRPDEKRVVVVGSGISGLMIAAELGRVVQQDPNLRVTWIIGPPPRSQLRLSRGCTVRYFGMHHLAEAFGLKRQDLIDHFECRDAGFRHTTFSVGGLSADERELTLLHTVAAESDQDIATSLHCNELRLGLRHFFEATDRFDFVAGSVVRGGLWNQGILPIQLGAEQGNLSVGKNAVVLNATSYPPLLRQKVLTLPVPSHYVMARQVTLKPTIASSNHGELGAHVVRVYHNSLKPGPEHHADQVVFVSPFHSTQFPDALYYGLTATVVSADFLEQRGAENLWDGLRQTFAVTLNQLGFEECHRDQTACEVKVPVRDLSGAELNQLYDDTIPVVEVSHAFATPFPIVYMDGVLAHAIGARVFVRTLLRESGSRPLPEGVMDALLAADEALDIPRGLNWGYVQEGLFMPSELDFLEALIMTPEDMRASEAWVHEQYGSIEVK